MHIIGNEMFDRKRRNVAIGHISGNLYNEYICILSIIWFFIILNWFL